ncbi:MAG: methionine biosynthesis protein MetW [Pseudomonadota bacterium]|nr:methionine biosynthesis protein MetW [Pseudomonadota bacterium]MEC8020247.1 methionine biosynthesis protein MetW [Pseudomonadota bacterium]|tara:strand:+ start:5379 stop:5984 length:606 start_codon:yes stop_codon:yes gene_type:complete
MVNNRTDLELITSLVDKEARILDVGCGNGELLKSLKNKKNVKGQGLELKQERVNKCVAKGLSAIQGNADSDLSLYPDQSFDCVILSQTIQATNNPKNILIELIRIGRKAIISIPNFGYWKVRLGFATYGKMPITEKLSNNWYDTPNIHLCSILDFVDLCRELNIKIEKTIVLNSNNIRSFNGAPNSWSNFFGEEAIFLIKN